MGIGGPLIYLIRHGKAEKQLASRDRRLTADGQRQAASLADALSGPIERVVASPARRCLETVAPLCSNRGLSLEIDERLMEGAPVGKLVELLREFGEANVVACSHGDLIPAVLRELETNGMRLEDQLRCETAGVWQLEGTPPSRATYFRPKARDETRERRLAVLDLGSTSFHLLVADVSSAGSLIPVDRERIMLRLGAAIVSDGSIPDAVSKRVVRAAKVLGETADRAGAEELLPIATSAVRDAANAAAVTKRLAKALDTPVRVLSGSEEAALTFRALGQRGSLGPGRSLAIDLGGGSLELALGNDSELHWETTLRLGVARLGRELTRRDPLSASDAMRVSDRVRDELALPVEHLRSEGPFRAVATGGTIRALGRRALARREEKRAPLSEVTLRLDEIREMRDELLTVSKTKRQNMAGIQRKRADLLPVGSVILTTLCDCLGIHELSVSDWGLREGVLLEAAESRGRPS